MNSGLLLNYHEVESTTATHTYRLTSLMQRTGANFEAMPCESIPLSITWSFVSHGPTLGGAFVTGDFFFPFFFFFFEERGLCLPGAGVIGL